MASPTFAPVESTCWKKVPAKVPRHPIAMKSQVGFEISSQETTALALPKVAACAFEQSFDPLVTQLTWLSPSSVPTTEVAWSPTLVYLSENNEIATLRPFVRFCTFVYPLPIHAF